ncbi:MAG: universal stress protein [Planctomycetaceae bacterium]
MIKRVLVGLAGTPFTSVAIRRAVELGRIHEAEVLGVTVIDRRRLRALMITRDGAGDVVKESMRIQLSEQRTEDSIEELETACAAAGVACNIKRETGDPFALMMALARYADVMVFGLRSLFEYDYACEKPSDVLAQIASRGVRPIIAVSQQFRPVRRVLLAYSGSMESAKTIKLFLQLRLWPEMTLKLVTCKHPADQAYSLLADAADYCHAHGYTPEIEYNPGSARKEILPLAEKWNADLIVMGNSARSFLIRKVFGETALNVMQNSVLPLFLSQ